MHARRSVLQTSEHIALLRFPVESQMPTVKCLLLLAQLKTDNATKGIVVRSGRADSHLA